MLQCRNSRYKRVLELNFATINRSWQPVDVVYNFVRFFMQPPNWLASSIESPRKMYTVWHRAVFRHVAFKSRPWNTLFITLQNKSTLVTSATNVSQRKKVKVFPIIHCHVHAFGTVRFWKLKKFKQLLFFHIYHSVHGSFVHSFFDKKIKWSWDESKNRLCFVYRRVCGKHHLSSPPPRPSTPIRNVPRHRRGQKVFISICHLSMSGFLIDINSHHSA